MSRTPAVDGSLDLRPQVGTSWEDDDWTDPLPRCRFELRYVPTVSGPDHDQALFEWTLEWLECADVATVRVDREVPDDGPSVRVLVDTLKPCSRAGETERHRALVSRLSRFGELRET
ncbi:hypothetical protein, partial [Halovivax sp.]|uniref:hypothetical protein n=1 Tax=Halovivax sp. TaxID=1935978 RepID=UPI0025B8B755